MGNEKRKCQKCKKSKTIQAYNEEVWNGPKKQRKCNSCLLKEDTFPPKKGKDSEQKQNKKSAEQAEQEENQENDGDFSLYAGTA